MNERQRRTDTDTANVVTRALNILAVRGRVLARHYLEVKHVSPDVIGRVLDSPAARRTPSAQQLISEAITPSSAGGGDG